MEARGSFMSERRGERKGREGRTCRLWEDLGFYLSSGLEATGEEG